MRVFLSVEYRVRVTKSRVRVKGGTSSQKKKSSWLKNFEFSMKLRVQIKSSSINQKFEYNTTQIQYLTINDHCSGQYLSRFIGENPKYASDAPSS